MSFKQFAIGTLGVILGNVIAERFVLKGDPEDPQGFVMVSDGVGLDEVARGALGMAGVMVIKKVIGRAF